MTKTMETSPTRIKKLLKKYPVPYTKNLKDPIFVDTAAQWLTELKVPYPVTAIGDYQNFEKVDYVAIVQLQRIIEQANKGNTAGFAYLLWEQSEEVSDSWLLSIINKAIDNSAVNVAYALYFRHRIVSLCWLRKIIKKHKSTADFSIIISLHAHHEVSTEWVLDIAKVNKSKCVLSSLSSMCAIHYISLTKFRSIIEEKLKNRTLCDGCNLTLNYSCVDFNIANTKIRSTLQEIIEALAKNKHVITGDAAYEAARLASSYKITEVIEWAKKVITDSASYDSSAGQAAYTLMHRACDNDTKLLTWVKDIILKNICGDNIKTAYDIYCDVDEKYERSTFNWLLRSIKISKPSSVVNVLEDMYNEYFISSEDLKEIIENSKIDWPYDWLMAVADGRIFYNYDMYYRVNWLKEIFKDITITPEILIKLSSEINNRAYTHYTQRAYFNLYRYALKLHHAQESGK